MYFIYYINRLITIKVDSIKCAINSTVHNVLCPVAAVGREPVTSRSLVRRLADSPTQIFAMLLSGQYGSYH